MLSTKIDSGFLPSMAGMEKINYCEVVISTDQEKEDIMNILNELEEEFPGLVSYDVKANAGELVAKYQCIFQVPFHTVIFVSSEYAVHKNR